jgi:O6-methylguanine-DNA--protein-cysteine methyltransferase
MSNANMLFFLTKEGPTSLSDMAQRFDRSTGSFAGDLVRNGVDIHWVDLHQLIFPEKRDLVPYLLLLGLNTGIIPEGLSALRLQDWSVLGNGSIRLKWYKARAMGYEADTFSDKGQWSPGALLRRVEAATGRLRSFGDEEALWLVYAPRGKQIIRPITTSDPWPITTSSFIKKHNIEADNGGLLVLERRALRKTYVARLDKKYHGAVQLIAGSNQSSQVAADHYLQTEETEVIRDVIERTQHEIVAQSARVHKVLVLNQEETDDLQQNLARASNMLQITKPKAQALLNEETEDVFAAKCKDFYNSPFSPKGTPCQTAVWDCLLCPNAVITPTKLPNLLALLDHIDDSYEKMSPTDWQARYGSVRRVIKEEVLPRFSDEIIAAARHKAEAAHLYIRPEDRV